MFRIFSLSLTKEKHLEVVIIKKRKEKTIGIPGRNVDYRHVDEVNTFSNRNLLFQQPKKNYNGKKKKKTSRYKFEKRIENERLRAN